MSVEADERRERMRYEAESRRQIAEIDARATIKDSANRLEATMAQVATMELGLRQASKDREFQTLAWLTDRLESLDSRTTIAVANAQLLITQDDNDFKIAAAKIRLQAVQQANRTNNQDDDEIDVMRMADA